jgi:hypothetical protein
LDRAYTYDLWAACGIVNAVCSDDGFYYFRSWLITQGEKVYEDALKDPETLADLDLPHNNLECQTLFQVAWWAYEAKTGEEFPQEIRLTWTTGNDMPSGERWTEDELETRYPRLVAASRN